MPESYPSRILTILDVPEVQTFNAEFSYNFFTPDEKVNDEGEPRAQGASSEEDIRRQISKRHPRFAKFSFSPVDIRSNSSADDEFVVSMSRPALVRQMIHDNLDKIQTELEVSSKAYSALNLQDGDISRKSNRILDLSVDIRTELEGSPVDRAKILNDLTAKSVTGKWILRLMRMLFSQK